MAVANISRAPGSGVRLLMAVVVAAILAACCVALSVGAPEAKETNIVAAQQRAATDAAAANDAAAAAKLAAAAAAKASAPKKKAAAAAAAAALAKAAQLEDAGKRSAAESARLLAAQPVASGSVYYAWFGGLALALLWLVSAVFAGDWNPFSLAVGMDNRLSTSKLQALLWTACVGFVYAMIYADRVIVYGHTAPITQIPQNVLFALGLSVTSAVAAKAITSSQVAANPGNKDAGAQPSYDPAALVREDGAATASLTKVQVLFWTAIAIVVYVNTAFHQLTTIVPCTDSCALPDIDTTLMIFMGLGHATYIGGKLVGNSTPMLNRVVGGALDPKTQLPPLTLHGASLGSSGTVLINGDALADDFVDSWTATLITFRLDPALGPWAPGDRIAIAVKVNDSASPAITYVFPAPSPQAAGPVVPVIPAGPVAPVTPADPIVTKPKSGDAPAASAGPAQALLRGIDVSYAQGLQIDWDAVKRGGLAGFAYARATYAANPANDDPNFVRNHDECNRLDIPFGAYHFFVFSTPAADQAQHFLSRIDGRFGTLCPVVDVEEQSGRGGSLQEMIANLSAFITAVEHALGRSMMIYTNADTWNNVLGGTDAFSGHRLWVANITENPDTAPLMPTGFRDWTVHQYSWNGKIPSTDGTFGKVDLNVLKGPLANLESPQPVVPAAAAVHPSAGPLASLRYDGAAKKLEGIDARGQRIFSYDARNDSVASNAWRPDAGCPPGAYRLLRPESNDPNQPSTGDNDWIGEGRWFIPLDGIPGHDGIGIHGGGTCKTPPDSNALMPRQGWCRTENCIRVQNADLAVLAGLPLAGKPIEVAQPPPPA